MYRPYGNSVPNAGNVSVDAAIRELVQDFCTAFNTGNYDQCARIFVPDGFFMPPGRESVQGHQPIERVLQKMGDLGYADMRQESVRIDASVDMAAEIGAYSLCLHQSDGTTIVDRGKYLNCWRRLGVWRLVASSWSSSLPRILPREPLRSDPEPPFITEINSKKSA